LLVENVAVVVAVELMSDQGDKLHGEVGHGAQQLRHNKYRAVNMVDRHGM
jgi:hypothetical protein